MKKWIIPVLLLAVALLVGAVVLCVQLLPHKQTTQPDPADVLSYAEAAYPEYVCDYMDDVLSLTKTLALTYEQACSIGGSIYCDELAPETYLDSVQSIALDIAGQCSCSVTVKLVQESSDDKPVFTVASDGEIFVCWED